VPAPARRTWHARARALSANFQEAGRELPRGAGMNFRSIGFIVAAVVFIATS
jgi:hypothetical protein